MSGFDLTYKRFGERSILIEWPSKINENILYDVLAFKTYIENNNIKDVVEIKSAYNSILISYDITIKNIYSAIESLKSLYAEVKPHKNTAITLWTIPVCYDKLFALDLEELSTIKNCSETDIIQWHTNAIYTVFFIGFLPGFYYLGGLDKKLHQPRRPSPRLKIDKGAVGIGGNQTGVYPNISPGGWNIIGNCPVQFFDVSAQPPCFAKAGDKIKFEDVSFKTYQDIKLLVEKGVYQIKSERFHG